MVNSIDKSYEPSYTDTQHIYSIVFWWYKRGDFDDYSLSGISIHKHNRLSSTPARRRSRVSSLSPEAHDATQAPSGNSLSRSRDADIVVGTQWRHGRIVFDKKNERVAAARRDRDARVPS